MVDVKSSKERLTKRYVYDGSLHSEPSRHGWHEVVYMAAEVDALFAVETTPALPLNLTRYKVQQDKGRYCLKGCPDGDLVDYSAYEALFRRLNEPASKVTALIASRLRAAIHELEHETAPVLKGATYELAKIASEAADEMDRLGVKTSPDGRD